MIYLKQYSDKGGYNLNMNEIYSSVNPSANTESTPDYEQIKNNEIKREKKILKRDCISAGVLTVSTLVALNAIAIVVMFIYIIFTQNRTLPANIDSLGDNIINSIAHLSGFTLLAIVFSALNKMKLREVLIFKKVGFFKLIGLCIIGFTVCMVSNTLTEIYLNNALNLGIDLNIDIETPVSNSPVEILVYFVSTAVVPAFTEEFVFRGVILSNFRKYGDAFAVLASSLLFGLMHGNFVQIPFAFVIGLVLGFTTVYTNSIFPAMAIHFLNNSFSVIADVLYSNADAWGINTAFLDISYNLIIGAIAILAVISLIIIVKKDRNFLKLRKYEGLLEAKTITKTFLFHPVMIFVYIVYFIESVSLMLLPI